MTVKGFFKFVELPTKIASVFPFCFATLFALYSFKTLNIRNLVLMFLSMICFDMATTAINNYIDFKTALKKHGYGYQIHNAMVSFNISENLAKNIIFILLFLAISFGLILSFYTNFLVLILGIVSFFVGIFYTFGPIPLSRMPLGEIFSGSFMGFVIPFLSIYIHSPNSSIASISILDYNLVFQINIFWIFKILMVNIVFFNTIANIMLANNICDLNDDIENKRFTLPYYLGKENCIKLFSYLYYSIYIFIFILISTKILPYSFIIIFFTFPLVKKNINQFLKIQKKDLTFVVSIKNFILINTSMIFSIIIAIIFLQK